MILKGSDFDYIADIMENLVECIVKASDLIEYNNTLDKLTVAKMAAERL